MKDTYRNIASKTDLTVPNGWVKVKTVEMHTAGEPLRVIVDGLPKLTGNSVLEYRRDFQNNHDHIRTALMFEPRGHADMYGCAIVPPNDDTADFGILFLHNEGYSTMCGHAIIAITKLAIELGWVKIQTPETNIEIDAPCGRIKAFATIEDGKVVSTYFYCVPSFVVALDQKVKTQSMGSIAYDLAYGGAFYAYVNADDIGINLRPENYSELIDKGMEIKKAVMTSSGQIQHPYEEDLSFLYGTIFISHQTEHNSHSRNVCVFADGEVDRSPTGSGVSGRVAIHHKRGEIKVGESIEIESILGTRFKTSVIEEVNYGGCDAVIPRVEGSASIIGKCEWLIDPNDPLKQGFLLR